MVDHFTFDFVKNHNLEFEIRLMLAICSCAFFLMIIVIGWFFE